LIILKLCALAILLATPSLKIKKTLRISSIASRNTASKYMSRLVDLGILKQEKIGKEAIFGNSALYEMVG
jgi:Fic family protein